jgi:hypothetical protein
MTLGTAAIFVAALAGWLAAGWLLGVAVAAVVDRGDRLHRAAIADLRRRRRRSPLT